MADSISDFYTLPLDDWIEAFVKDWLVPNFRPAFQAIQWPINQTLNGLEDFLIWLPFPVFVVVVPLFAWRVAGRGVAIFSLLAVIMLDLLGIWQETMVTLSMILTAVTFCVIVGVPLGILAARSDRFAAFIRPILDIMQTIPPFVYLVPIVMLFGVGIVPGVIATIIFALPPMIRLTNLGIRQVQSELVEAGLAFGSTRRQLLLEIQVPLALRTIMAGLNQTLMLSLSMVVIAALIGAGGLGLTVYTGLGRLDVGAASLGGIGIVLLAIMLDRITQALGETSPAGSRKRSFRQLARRLFGRHRQEGEEKEHPERSLPGGSQRLSETTAQGKSAERQESSRALR
jgi:glycine betaine/proline transport system permease protein